MKMLTEFIFSLARYYKRFGYAGLIFGFKKYFNKNAKITFSLPNYPYPITLRNDTSDIPTFYQVIYNEDYNIDFELDPKVIVDCGANIGLATIYFKNKFPKAKIISIELEPKNYELLIENTKPYQDVFCLNFGIWNKNTDLTIKNNGFDNWGYRSEEADKNGNGPTISSITINDIIKQYEISEIDILKIDIEGSEKELFESNFEDWLSKTKIVIIELHDRIKMGASRSFFNALSKYDYSISQRGENIICSLNSATKSN